MGGSSRSKGRAQRRARRRRPVFVSICVYNLEFTPRREPARRVTKGIPPPNPAAIFNQAPRRSRPPLHSKHEHSQQYQHTYLVAGPSLTFSTSFLTFGAMTSF